MYYFLFFSLCGSDKRRLGDKKKKYFEKNKKNVHRSGQLDVAARQQGKPIGRARLLTACAWQTVLAERRTLLPLTATSTGDRGGAQVVPSSIGTSLSSSASTDRTITTIATTKLAIQQQHGDEGQEEDQQHKDAEVPQMRQLRKRTKVVYTPMPKRQRASAAAAGKKSAARSRSCKESSLLHKELVCFLLPVDN